MKHRRLAFVALLAAGAAAPASHAQQLRAVLISEVAPAPGFTGLAQPPGSTRDLLVLEKRGRVRLLRDGAVLPAPVVDLTASVHSIGEAGMLGVVFHPQFQSNGYVYLAYSGTPPGETGPTGVHLVRYTLDPADPTAVIPGSLLRIMSIPRDLPSEHFGGWLAFGPDGYLYFSSGDGAGPAQDPASLGGKMLRIDPDGDDFPLDPTANYAVPPTNPFFGSSAARPEVWALGLRNPWRCSFDRLTGDLWIGDVGEGLREEVDLQPAAGPPPYAAANYGWPCLEGTLCADLPECPCDDPSYSAPIYEYPHTTSEDAVIGGYVYRGTSIPGFAGTYLFGDIDGTLSSFRYVGGRVTEFTDRTAELGPLSPWAWAEGTDGELYCAGYFGGATPGFGVFRIDAACAANCDNSTQPPVLNVNDFICFLQAFAGGEPYANCDGSTTPPVLNVNDFICFQFEFAEGCP